MPTATRLNSKISDGTGRALSDVCLGNGRCKGEPYLVAGWRPFSASACLRGNRAGVHCTRMTAAPARFWIEAAPCPVFLESPDYILRGYDRDEKIVYGSGGVVPRGSIPDRIKALLCKPDIESVHIRSSRNNCYHCRVVRQD
jgi:hypothetical protein